MASKEDVTNAVALNSAVFNAARLIGPAFAGYIIYTLSIDMCFFLKGISYIAVIVGLLMMRFDRPQVAARSREGSRMGAMMEGIRYLYSVPQLRSLMFLVLGMTLFGWSYTVNLPVVAGNLLRGGASTYSALLSANGAGALLAALSQAALAGRAGCAKNAVRRVGSFYCVVIFAFGRAYACNGCSAAHLCRMGTHHVFHYGQYDAPTPRSG